MAEDKITIIKQWLTFELRMLKIKEIYVRIIGIPILGIFLAIAFCPSGFPTLLQFLKTICFTITFWQGFYFIISYFRKRHPKILETKKRLSNTLISLIAYLIVSDTLLRYFFDYIIPESTWEIDSIFWHTVSNFFICIAVGMVYELFYFFDRWHQSTLETEKLRTQQITSQFEALKSQISPHFLFNSLNTLAAIIPENQQQAVLFTQKLADVYRYILKYQEQELVSLETELEFINSFLFLLKIRYPQNLNVDIQIDEIQRKQYVAPLTLQLLVENAIKHNIISKSQPLSIEIYSEKEGTILVKNKLQKKSIAKTSTKTGIENIKKRYQLLTDKTVEIVETTSYFKVRIPLLQLSQEKDIKDEGFNHRR